MSFTENQYYFTVWMKTYNWIANEVADVQLYLFNLINGSMFNMCDLG